MIPASIELQEYARGNEMQIKTGLFMKRNSKYFLFRLVCTQAHIQPNEDQVLVHQGNCFARPVHPSIESNYFAQQASPMLI